MKRIYNLLVVLTIGLCSTTCKKEHPSSTRTADPFIEKAKEYFNSNILPLPLSASDNPRAAAAKTVSWEQATRIDWPLGQAVLVPLQYEKDLFIQTTQGGANSFRLSNLARLLVYQSKDGFHAEVVTGFPDTNYLRHPRGPFSGIAYVEDWAGQSLAKYLYEGGVIRKYAPADRSSVQSLNIITIEVCYQVTGYNYSPAFPSERYAWAETPVCRPSMALVEDDPVAIDYGNVAGGGGGGGGGTTGNGSAAAFSIAIGGNPITNIADYIKCFTNSPSSTYQVMVCVDQPKPGSRTAWSLSASDGSTQAAGKTNPVDVGHVFLVFTETTGGNTITRNVGFYPKTTVNPIYTNSPGILNNDEMHPYNISGAFAVNSNLFFNMLTYVVQNSGNSYDLDENNCTTFAINTLATGHIYLPSTIGSWIDGMGNDPGDLGEDIRATNFVGMTRSTDQAVHINVGTCN